MNRDGIAPEVTVWTDAGGAAVAGAVLDLMGSAVRPIGVGGTRTTEVDRLARDLGCPREDDLRKLLVDHPSAFLLLTSLESVGPDELLTATAQGTLVLTLEPIAADLQSLDTLAARRSARVSEPGRPAAGAIVHAPAFRLSPGFLRAADPYDVLGDRRVISYESVGRRGAGSLFARLFDAWQTVLAFVDLPESVDASLIGPAADPPDELRDMTGRLAAHARSPDGSAVVLHLADSAGDTRRSLHVIGDAGQLRITDGGYELRHLDGQLVDREAGEGPIDFADLLAAQWRRLLDLTPLSLPDPAPHAGANALACCLACLLSARTAQPESPRKLLRMNR